MSRDALGNRDYKEPETEEGLQILLYQSLKRFLQRETCAEHFGRRVVGKGKQFQVTHAHILGRVKQGRKNLEVTNESPKSLVARPLGHPH